MFSAFWVTVNYAFLNRKQPQCSIYGETTPPTCILALPPVPN